MTAYVRRLSPVERTWLVADALRPPFVNQLVLEGSGELDPDAWTRAVARASDACPGSRVRLRGALWRCRWVDTGRPPPVRTVAGDGWDGRSGVGAPFLAGPLSPRRGPTCEVLLVAGDRPRVVLRSHHSVMDGRGTLAFAEDVARCLSGEAPCGAPGTTTDLELARSLAPPPAEARAEDCLPPVPPAGEDPGVTWRRVTLRGPQSRLLPRVALVLAAEARRHGEGRVRLDVPVDLRPRAPLARSTANLTGMVHVEVPEGATAADVESAFRRELDEGREASGVLGYAPLRIVPLWLMRRVGRAAARRTVRGHGDGRHRYICTAVLSNLGRLEPDRLAGGGFQARTAFFVPPGVDTIPLFVALTGDEARVELVASMPRSMDAGGRLCALLGAVEAALSG